MSQALIKQAVTTLKSAAVAERQALAGDEDARRTAFDAYTLGRQQLLSAAAASAAPDMAKNLEQKAAAVLRKLSTLKPAEPEPSEIELELEPEPEPEPEPELEPPEPELEPEPDDTPAHEPQVVAARRDPDRESRRRGGATVSFRTRLAPPPPISTRHHFGTRRALHGTTEGSAFLLL